MEKRRLLQFYNNDKMVEFFNFYMFTYRKGTPYQALPCTSKYNQLLIVLAIYTWNVYLVEYLDLEKTPILSWLTYILTDQNNAVVRYCSI